MQATLTQLPAWLALREHQRTLQDLHLRDLLDHDPRRFDRLALECADILFDFSKHLVTDETLRRLGELARERDMPASIERLFSGERVNVTEGRAALHTALRSRDRLVVEGIDITEQVRRVRAQMRRFCDDLWDGNRRGGTGRAFTDVVSLGIGGSELGPALACDALAPYARAQPRLHFVSNVDGAHLAATLQELNPETTLFIVSSKSFATLETLVNARSARAWIDKKLGTGSAARHFAAVTARPAAAREFGIEDDAVFEIWDWVGGRYSLWSAVGLPLELAAGHAVFDELLDGARDMDAHFRNTPLERNVPVLAGLIDVWYVNFFGAAVRAVFAYDQRLKRLPEYLQQLEMESNGKSVTRAGHTVGYATAPPLIGAVGTPAQHALMQMLHQGTAMVPADFIACCAADHSLPGHHATLLANCIAQTQALARGRTPGEAAAEMRRQGLSEARGAELLPHCVFVGNRPTTTILLPRLSARALGALIAFYEHRTYVQSVIWDINAFDQWGVELGKEIAGRLLPELTGDAPPAAHDASTQGLINHYRRRRQDGQA